MQLRNLSGIEADALFLKLMIIPHRGRSSDGGSRPGPG